ncbi:MAG: GTP pyrophosphokinase family protein [Firmicutes bacterium]|nr:GTP pyrophosphokinase family protein [Bacillota bacterium]
MSDKGVLNSLENIMSSDQTLQFAQEMMIRFNRLMSYYKCAMMEIETKFRVLKEEYSLRHDRNPINTIESRLKRMQSIKEKLDRRGVPVSIAAIEEELNDVAGIRVICSFTEDVYTIAETFLKQDDITLIEKKDYIKNPKENGYRSLHLIVAVPIFLENEKRIMKVEVQLRTIAMDCWANLEHQLNYKKEHDFNEKMIKELAECARLSAQLDEKMDELRRKVSI